MKATSLWILLPLFAAGVAAQSPGAPEHAQRQDPDAGKEIAAGHIQRLVLSEDPRSATCTFRLDFPNSWARAERNPADASTVVRYRSGNGQGPITCTVNAAKAFDGSVQLTEEKAAELLAPDKLREMLGDSASRVLAAEARTIAGKPGGRMVYDVAEGSPSAGPAHRIVSFATLDRNYLVTVAFQLRSDGPGAPSLDEAQKAFSPTFEAILKTAVRGEPPAGADNTPAVPDEVDRRNEASELMTALKAGIDQMLWLERIGEDFPDLRDPAREAATAYDASAFGKGLEGAVERLRALQGGKFGDTYAALIRARRAETLRKPLTAKEAAKYLAEVKARTTTGPAEDIRRTLLSVNPQFRKEPVQEISAGWTQRFTLADSLPLEDYQTRIDLPASWLKEVVKGASPAVVFRSDNGYGPIACTVRVRKVLDAPISDEQAATLYTPEQLKARTADENTTIFSAGPCEISGRPGGWLLTETQGPDPKLARHTTTYVTLEGPHLVRIDFAILQQKMAPLTLAEAQKRWDPLFETILRTFVRDTRHPPAGDPASAAKASRLRGQEQDFTATLQFLNLQSLRLSRIATEYPALHDQAGRVTAAFAASPYGKSEEALLAGMKRLKGGEFETAFAGQFKQWREAVQQAPLTAEIAAKYLDEVSRHTRGDLPASLTKTLIATNQEYREKPVAEIAAGCTQRVSLAEQFKISDSKAHLDFPISWECLKKNGPTPVLVFRSGNGLGAIKCVLTVNKAVEGGIPNDAQVAAYLAPEKMRQANHDDTMTVLDALSRPVAGRPGVCVHAQVTDPATHVISPVINFLTFDGPYLINASFAIEADPASKQDPEEARKALLPLFDAILDSLVRE